MGSRSAPGTIEEDTLVTLSDVAARAGLSPMTASRVFSGRGRVSVDSRDRVLAAAAELGYVPNAVARSLRSSRSDVVALIVSDIGNAFFAQIAKRAERALSAAGYRVMIASSDEDPSLQADLLRGVAQMRADGVIVVPSPGDPSAIRDLAAGTPVVQLDRAAEGVDAPAVLLDNASAAADAIAHLAERGYRRPVLISGPQSLTTGAERVSGAREEAARRPGLELHVVEAHSFMHEPSVDVVRAALALGPDAVIAGNNIVLEACLDAFARDGVRVPDDVGLVGFDDFPWMGWVTPSITTVRQPTDAMADAAVAALLARMDGTVTDPAPARFAATLVPRDSSRPRATT